MPAHDKDMSAQSRQAMQQAESAPSPWYVGGVFASIGLSALLFASGKKDLGIFVGLWPPTILNLALFAKRLRPSQEMS